MTARGDHQPEHKASEHKTSLKTSLEDAVDRLDAKAAEEHGTETLADETPKRGSPNEPPD